MDQLILEDSQYIKSELKESGAYTTLYCEAVDKLRKEIKDKKIEFFSLGGKSRELNDDLIWYEINSSKEVYSNYASISKATFYTSHYIGFYSTIINGKTIDIIIKPRFGNESGIFNYLLSYAYGVYLPKGTSSSKNEKTDNLWLLAILYKATFNKAITKSQIPKEYKKMQKNLHTFKGQLHISKHIEENLFDKSKFYCTYRKLTMDVTINQTIRYVYKLLKQKGFSSLFKDMGEYDQMLQSFGVQDKKIRLNDIQNIKYTKLNIYYKKLMELATLLLKNSSKSSDMNATNNESFAYFLDMAQLWEDYLLKVLQKNLPEYYIYSPNDKGGVALFEDGSRTIRPDIIIEKDGEVIAILDAKYKFYKQIGRIEKYGIGRDDLYQMTTYLYHYGKNDKEIVGLFISPVADIENNSKKLMSNKNHKIGVVNLNIDQFSEKKLGGSSNEAIKEEEKKFIEKIKKELQNDPI